MSLRFIAIIQMLSSIVAKGCRPVSGADAGSAPPAGEFERKPLHRFPPCGRHRQAGERSGRPIGITRHGRLGPFAYAERIVDGQYARHLFVGDHLPVVHQAGQPPARILVGNLHRVGSEESLLPFDNIAAYLFPERCLRSVAVENVVAYLESHAELHGERMEPLAPPHIAPITVAPASSTAVFSDIMSR